MHYIGLTRQEIEHLQEVIARLEAQAPAGAEDRRVNPRIDFTHSIWLNLPSERGRPWMHVYSRNLSTGGLGFLSRNLMYTGQHVVIAHELNELTPMLVLSRVCYCRPVDLGIFEVGLAFVAARPDLHEKREMPVEWLLWVQEMTI